MPSEKAAVKKLSFLMAKDHFQEKGELHPNNSTHSTRKKRAHQTEEQCHNVYNNKLRRGFLSLFQDLPSVNVPLSKNNECFQYIQN